VYKLDIFDVGRRSGAGKRDGADRAPNRRTAMGKIGVRWILMVAALISSATSLTASPVETPFLSEKAAAMKRMMAAMNITPTGDVDRDFVAMMVPHHQGAIDMAMAELRHGRNEQLKRLAQGIIVTQTQEIQAMRLALGQPPGPAEPAHDSHAVGGGK
jgi:Domain of unknown function (DUF305)